MSGVKRSQSVKCNNSSSNRGENQCGVMSPNVDFLAELRNNKQFKRQEEKFNKWENRKSVSLEDLRTDRMVMVKEKGGSEVALNETKTSLLAALMGRGTTGRNVSKSYFFFVFWQQ